MAVTWTIATTVVLISPGAVLVILVKIGPNIAYMKNEKAAIANTLITKELTFSARTADAPAASVQPPANFGDHEEVGGGSCDLCLAGLIGVVVRHPRIPSLEC